MRHVAILALTIVALSACKPDHGQDGGDAGPGLCKAGAVGSECHTATDCLSNNCLDDNGGGCIEMHCALLQGQPLCALGSGHVEPCDGGSARLPDGGCPAPCPSGQIATDDGGCHVPALCEIPGRVGDPCKTADSQSARACCKRGSGTAQSLCITNVLDPRCDDSANAYCSVLCQSDADCTKVHTGYFCKQLFGAIALCLRGTGNGLGLNGDSCSAHGDSDCAAYYTCLERHRSDPSAVCARPVCHSAADCIGADGGTGDSGIALACEAQGQVSSCIPSGPGALGAACSARGHLECASYTCIWNQTAFPSSIDDQSAYCSVPCKSDADCQADAGCGSYRCSTARGLCERVEAQKGDAGVGALCAHDEDCAGAQLCWPLLEDSTNPPANRHCTPVCRGDLDCGDGGVCAQIEDACLFVCHFDGGDSRCADSRDCPPGSGCTPALDRDARRCAARCDLATPCASGTCLNAGSDALCLIPCDPAAIDAGCIDPSMHCEPALRACHPRHAIGAPCESADACIVGDCDGGICVLGCAPDGGCPAGSSCVGAASSDAGLCASTRIHSVGFTCTPQFDGGDCDSGACVRGADGGALCSVPCAISDAGCADPCPAGLACVAMEEDGGSWCLR